MEATPVSATAATLDVIVFGVLPYVAVATLVVGTIWRFRYDTFGWTTRSSGLYESRLLTIASPLFHFGILVVLMGHIVGLVIPESWTDAAGVSEDTYHLMAVTAGLVSGTAAVVGLAMLVYRRRTTGAVFLATTRNDKMMYVVLGAVLVTGLGMVLYTNTAGDVHNYRETVSVWFRSLFVLQPDVDAMAAAPAGFKVHVVIAFTLFAMWPFTRLVHAFSAPLRYVFRPYVVYRSKGTQTVGAGAGGREARRGWEPVGTQDRR